MHNYIGMKLKRKDLDEVNDVFSDFSLSCPARKIRRLDAELPPIMEDAEFMVGYEHSITEGGIEELPFVHQNKEQAIVPFNPMDGSLTCSRNSYSIDPNLISCLKNQAFSGSHLTPTTSINHDYFNRNGDVHEVNTCRAVIPWVPSSQHHIQQRPAVVFSQPEVSDPMEEEPMDIEESSASDYVNYSRISEGYQWQQQHCIVPQPPRDLATPLVWYR